MLRMEKLITEANINTFRILFYYTAFGNNEITGAIGYEFIQCCMFFYEFMVKVMVDNINKV